MAHALLGALPILLAAQATQATIVGTVRDGTTAAPLAGAVVSLTDLERSAVTDSAGRYELILVPAGPQHLAVRCFGYAPRSLHALVPREGRLEIDVALEPRPFQLETHEVRVPVSLRGLDPADSSVFPDRRVSIAAVRNDPLLAEPDVFQALGGGEVVLRPETPSGVHIRGGATDQTAYLLDGIPVFSPFHAAGLSGAWNPDAISRLQLSSAAPSAVGAHALSGAIEGWTRTPGPRLGAQGAVSTTQSSVTLDGPLGVAGAGFVLSLRSAMHDVIAPADDASYLQGGAGDWLATLDAPTLGGRLRVLGYGNANEIGSAATLTVDSTGLGPRNRFEWYSRSLGAEWRRSAAHLDLRLIGWGAEADASSAWLAPASPVELEAGRRDAGLLAALEHRAAGATTAGELRLERSRTWYRTDSDSTPGPDARLEARTPVATLAARHTRAIGSRVEAELGAELAVAEQGAFIAPRARCRCEVSERLSVTGAYARTHQFAQSLRNGESVIGNVFPVDAFIGAGAPGVPVARGDQGVVALDWRPAPGVRLGLQGYERRAAGLLLVAPRTGGPFSTGAFVVGTGSARGLAIDFALGTTRLGLIGSYGLQRVRLAHGDSAYVPDHGATHLFEGGVIVFPRATTSLRLGASAALGRRSTAIPGAFEWESCNLMDQGCELAGSPDYGGEALGGTALPPYVRLDLGLRQHWHLQLGGRDATVALFASATNLLGRKNVLTYARDPATGERMVIEMRPPSPLVVGMDWRF